MEKRKEEEGRWRRERKKRVDGEEKGRRGEMEKRKEEEGREEGRAELQGNKNQMQTNEQIRPSGFYGTNQRRS